MKKKGNFGPQASRPARRKAQALVRDAYEGIEKNRPGRPSPYRPSYVIIARSLALLGLTDVDLARHFNTDQKTIERWKKNEPKFCLALKEGREEANAKVAESLWHRAMGYEHEDLYIAQYQGEIITKKIIKRYPPEVAACIFWLKNRAPELWRDRIEYVPPPEALSRVLREQMALMEKTTSGAAADKGVEKRRKRK